MHNNQPTQDDDGQFAPVPQEIHRLEIESPCRPGERLKLSQVGANKEFVWVCVSTADYNVGVVVSPEQLLLAARAFAELPAGRDSVEPTYSRMQRVLDEVAAERVRQNALYEAGDIPFNCADPNVSVGVKLGPITEEFLEAVQEIQMLNSGSTITVRDTARRNLRVEAIQCAAVFTALAESLQP